MILAPEPATPAMPTPLSVSAAATLDTDVPWPLGSSVGSAADRPSRECRPSRDESRPQVVVPPVDPGVQHGDRGRAGHGGGGPSRSWGAPTVGVAVVGDCVCLAGVVPSTEVTPDSPRYLFCADFAEAAGTSTTRACTEGKDALLDAATAAHQGCGSRSGRHGSGLHHQPDGGSDCPTTLALAGRVVTPVTATVAATAATKAATRRTNRRLLARASDRQQAANGVQTWRGFLPIERRCAGPRLRRMRQTKLPLGGLSSECDK